MNFYKYQHPFLTFRWVNTVTMIERSRFFHNQTNYSKEYIQPKKKKSIKGLLTFLFYSWCEPWKDCYLKYFRAFGLPISLRSHNKLRLSRGFEMKEDTIKRSTTEKNKIDGKFVCSQFIYHTSDNYCTLSE